MPPRAVSGPTLLTGICFCASCGGAMTLRTGKGSAGGMYRYYTCSMKARRFTLSTAAPSSIWQRLLWFVGLWAAGVGCVAAVGYIIRLWLL